MIDPPGPQPLFAARRRGSVSSETVPAEVAAALETAPDTAAVPKGEVASARIMAALNDVFVFKHLPHDQKQDVVCLRDCDLNDGIN